MTPFHKWLNNPLEERNMNLTEFKRELSKVSGVDFFNPKYRDIFKRHLTPTEDEEVEKSEEIEKAKDADETNEIPTVEVEVEVETKDEEESSEEPAEETESLEPVESANELSAEEKALRELIGDEESETYKEMVTEKSDIKLADEPVIKTEAESQPAINLADQLQETQLELELVKAGVREDRIDIATRLFLPELKAGVSIDEIRGKILPEWIGKKNGVQSFGMPLGEKATPLTNEEKALKKMGIDPRD